MASTSLGQPSKKRKWRGNTQQQQSVDNPVGFLSSYQNPNMGEYLSQTRGEGRNREFQALVTFRGKIYESENFHSKFKNAKKDVARVVIRENGGWHRLTSTIGPQIGNDGKKI